MWDKKEGHEYYRREPKKPTHMKGLSRVDYYVLIRLRSGADNRGHEECEKGDNRYHLIRCNKYDRPNLDEEDLYDDKRIPQWKEWWTRNEYLRMGIPMNMKEQQGVRVMFGNPFDNTIKINENGRVVKMKVDQRCSKCGTNHVGMRVKKVALLETGRWFSWGRMRWNARYAMGNSEEVALQDQGGLV